jgi:hypothetical protein
VVKKEHPAGRMQDEKCRMKDAGNGLLDSIRHPTSCGQAAIFSSLLMA